MLPVSPKNNEALGKLKKIKLKFDNKIKEQSIVETKILPEKKLSAIIMADIKIILIDNMPSAPSKKL